jgi:protein-S-isoprenylcysteine O-methyltransferase Ste14
VTEPSPPASGDRLVLRVLDIAERAFIVLLFISFVVGMRHGLALRPYNLIVVVHEALTVFFILTRRMAQQLTLKPFDWMAALLGTGLPLLVRPGGDAPMPQLVGTVLMTGGILFSLSGLLFLRRSFGVAAANRGVVNGGPYRLVRHPIYLGYLCTHIGFLLNNPTWLNAALYFVATAFQIWRILAEERVLSADPAYAELRTKVRWRLVPGIF